MTDKPASGPLKRERLRALELDFTKLRLSDKIEDVTCGCGSNPIGTSETVFQQLTLEDLFSAEVQRILVATASHSKAYADMALSEAQIGELTLSHRLIAFITPAARSPFWLPHIRVDSVENLDQFEETVEFYISNLAAHGELYGDALALQFSFATPPTGAFGAQVGWLQYDWHSENGIEIHGVTKGAESAKAVRRHLETAMRAAWEL